MTSLGEWVKSVWQRFSAQHQLLIAIMGWPVFYYLEKGEGVFQWSFLLQCVLLIYLLVLASRQEGWHALRSGRLKHVWVLLWVFLLYMTVTTLVHSPIFLNGIAGYLKHVQFVLLLLVCSAIGLAPDLLRRWFVPYVLTLIVLLILPLALSAIGLDLLPARSLYIGPGLTRAGGYVRYRFVFGNPNQFADFLACVIGFCLFLSVSQLRAARVAIPVAGIVLLGGYLLFVTLSRRVWLLLPVVLVLGIALQRGLGKRAWLAFGSVLLLVLVVYPFQDQIMERLSSLLLFRDAVPLRQTGPLHIRLIFWERVIAYLRTPLEWAFGLGAGTIGYAVRNYSESGYYTVDGYYAILLGEHGLVGVLLYCALVLAALLQLVRAVVRRRLALDREEVIVASLVGSLAVLLSGLIGNANTTFPQALYLWAFLGIGLAATTRTGVAAVQPGDVA